MSYWHLLRSVLASLAGSSQERLSRGCRVPARRRVVLEPLEDRRLLSVVYVDHDAGGAGNGTSWLDAYTDLRVALTQANSRDEVWVAEGTYTPCGSGDRSLSFNLKTGVDVYGGFDGCESSLEERDSAGHVTTLSGDIGTTDEMSDNSYHVVYASSVTDAILDGFTITAGNANGANPDHFGGGMYNQSASSPTVTNVVFSGNSANYGGGMCNENASSPTLTNVIFSGNSADHGGGMYNHYDSSPTLTNVIFSGNSATYSGGGMDNFAGSSPRLTNVTFSGNSAGSGGGMHSFSECSASLTNVTFSGNSAGGDGGGIWSFSRCSASLTNVTFSGNSAGGHGGGILSFSECSASLTNVTFSGNSAGGDGGGIYNVSECSARLTNVTFTGNSAGGKGGAICTVFDCFAALTNCILWGNTAATGAEIRYASGYVTVVNHSIVAGGWTGPGNLNADPLFVRPPSAGADGTWGTPDDDFGDLHLRVGSPAIDTGTSSGAPAMDLDGRERPRDGDQDGLAVPDMGAYEYSRVLFVDWDAGGTGDGSSWDDAYTDLQVALNAAITGDEVWAAEGTYRPTEAGGNRGLAFNLKSGVDVYGGFGGGETARVDRDWVNHVTVLSGDLNGDDTSGGNSENSYHVVYASGVTDATVDGFTITAGNADGAYPNNSGGGMLNENSGSPTLTNITFSGNSASDGAGMYNGGSSSPTLTNVTFSGNSAGRGGGIYNNDASSPTLTNVTFSGNSADHDGGSMYNFSNSTPTLTNCILWGNTARTGPEILDNSGCTSTVNYSIVADGWTGPGNLDADPQFVRPPSDGGDGWDDDPSTSGVDESANDDYGDLRLTPGSPAVDAGDPSFDPNDFTPPLVIDQQGAPRVLDGNGDGSILVDMGALEFVYADWGDAPAPYATMGTDGGPYHVLRTGLRLGTEWDWEPDGQPRILADGDDVGSTPDDEDGLIDPVGHLTLTLGTQPLVDVTASNSTGKDATLSGWIDYNHDGVFDNATERAQAVVPDGTIGGVVTLAFPRLLTEYTGTTYARFRLSTDSAASEPTGCALDGEVEDYLVTIIGVPGVDLLGMGFDVTPDNLLDGTGTATVEFVLRNFGDTAAGPFDVQFYLSDDEVIDPATDILVNLASSDPSYDPSEPEAYHVAGLVSAGRYESTVTLSVPVPDPFGTDGEYFLGMFVDADADVVEANEGNNHSQGQDVDVDDVEYTPGPLDHFVWDLVASPQTRAVPFEAQIRAADRYGWTVTSFGGTVSLSGSTLTPSVTSSFVSGEWTGEVTIFDVATDLVLRAADGNGHAGVTNSFDVVPGPADFDYGDAPDTGTGTGAGDYRTLWADNGPRHTVVGGLFMGDSVDVDDGTLQSIGADADDTDQLADEDGLIDPATDLTLTLGTQPTVNVSVTNTTGVDATLSGWIDYNTDGVFDNATERVQAVVPDGTVGGTVTLTFPHLLVEYTGTTYARFRLSTDPTANEPTGRAWDGEVEDYLATINAVPGVDLVGMGFDVTPDNLLDGTGTATVEFVLRNFGDTAAGSFDVQFYLSDDELIDPATDILVNLASSDPGYDPSEPEAYHVAGLVSAGRYESTVILSVPVPDPFGTDGEYFLGMFVDADADVVEANEGNNRNQGQDVDVDDVEYTPGPLDHFVWDPVASPQARTVPFEAQIRAADTYGWTVTSFNDTVDLSGWMDEGTSSTIVIAECNEDTPDYVEIQNVSGRTVDTSGWVVALNDAEYGNISTVHSVTWSLPDFMVADEIMYRTDSSTDNYWGSNIWWGSATKNGWAMIVDNAGDVVDFVVWGYTSSQIAGMSVVVNGHTVTVGSEWSGDGMAFGGSSSLSLQRLGNGDNNNADDLAWVARSKGAQNAGLTVPFALPVSIVPSSATFVAGVWTGEVTVLDVATDIRLRADDGNGHVGITNPFDVIPGPADFDFGDAPEPGYPTLLLNDGARHRPFGPTLGSSRDWENDGFPSVAADGDDTSGTVDDEDGVAIAPLLAPGIKGTTLTVEASGPSFLNAWIDFNADGDWGDPGEQVAVDRPLVAGSNTVPLDVPLSAVPGLTYARLRLTSYDTGGTLPPTGPADDGEVEDYAWTIENHLYLYGGDAVNDAITIWVGSPGGFYHQVKINGSVSHYDAAVYNAIRIDGRGGNDTITIYGTNQDETVTLQPGSASVVGQTYALYVTGVETITVDAGLGSDQVSMTGSSGSNRLYSYADYARLTDSARSFSYRVEGFEVLTVDVSGGSANSAYFYDTPDDDELTVEPGLATFKRSAGTATETTTTAIGFQQVYAYSTAGDDTAAWTASDATQNRFYGYADYALFTEARRSFYFYARGFDDVTATSPASLPAYAYLYDSPEVDAFIASTTSATMDREGPCSDTTATGFARVYAYSTRGGADTAVLNGSSTGGNNYRGYPAYSTLYDSTQSFYHYVRGFHSVTAAGSKDHPSRDRAYLYDSPGADTFDEAFWEENKYQGGSLTDTGNSYELWIKYFDYVYARSTDSGTDDTIAVENETLLAYRLLRMGTW